MEEETTYTIMGKINFGFMLANHTKINHSHMTVTNYDHIH